MTVPTSEAITDQILEIFRRSVRRALRNAVQLDARLYVDLEMDSLKLVSTLLLIERELGVTIPWDAPGSGEVRTIADVIRFIAWEPAAGTR